jgi:hypothetical protein
MAKIWSSGAEFMDDDEIKRLERMKQDFLDAARNLNPQPHLVSHGWTSSFAISPTDVNAKGKFQYQEPEVDEQGTYYGYKVLNEYHNFDADIHRLVSPRYTVMWGENGSLAADKIPNEHSMHGLHFTKRPDHPELRNYVSDYELSWKGSKKSVLVKCALSGEIVETEQGFRAEHAQIIGVYTDGYWKSYQGYQERSLTNSRRDAFEKIAYDVPSNPYTERWWTGKDLDSIP